MPPHDITHATQSNHQRRLAPAWLAAPFRPFFLGAGVVGAVAIPLWLAMLFGALNLSTALPPLQWHVHEMLFGLVGAAAAGFLLTAVTVWTRTDPIAGWRLYVLLGLWVLARVLMLFGGDLPPWVAWLPDCVFLAGVAALVGVRSAQARQWRQLPLVAALLAMCLAAWLFPRAGVLDRGVVIVVADAIVVLMVVIGGRITPAFTRNWLRLRGGQGDAAQDPGIVQQATILSALGMLLADVFGSMPAVSGVFALITALSLAARLVLWRPWRVVREPLLWVLHLGLAWVAAALILRVVTQTEGLPETLWLHALGAGAMGTLILGVMTRVGLGHTGRTLTLPRGAVICYLAISAAALARVMIAVGWLPYYHGLLFAGGSWSLSFALFLVLYTPILIRPRADGRPG